MATNKRLESEFKLAVPKGHGNELWAFLKNNYSSENLKSKNPNLTSVSEEEKFIDQYFDTPENQLLKNNIGVRYRRRFLGDSLLKELVQIKLPGGDTTGVVRKEIKFDIYDNIKKRDRKALHQFWKYVRPKDRDEANIVLAEFGILGNDLSPSLKLQQNRRRIYIFETNEPLMTITLDEASYFYFPYPSFTEIEMELNEIRYTRSDQKERRRMETFNQQIKKELFNHFPKLVQDQSPKYNKMNDLVSGNIITNFSGNFSYVVLGGLASIALFLFFKHEI